MPEGKAGDKITIISSRHCPGCVDLKRAVKELGLKNISILEIEKSKKGLAIANHLNINAVPVAVIAGKKYRIFRDGKCLVFQSKGSKIRICGQS